MRTIADQFKDFWITGDPKQRGRSLALAICLMAIYGLVFSAFGRQPRSDTAHQALAVGAAFMLLFPFAGKRQASLRRLNFRPKKDTIIITASALSIFLIGQASFSLQNQLATRSLERRSEERRVGKE